MISSILLCISVMLYVASLIVGCMGVDKITNYANEYPNYVNSYVGGDAYNYIINGTYSTSFFVIASALAIMATMFLCIFILIEKE